MEIIGNFGNVNAPSNITAKSISVIPIAIGVVTLLTQTNKAFIIGMNVKISNSLNNWLFGTITEYNMQTGVLVVDIQSVSGLGTYSMWDIFITTPFSTTGSANTASVHFLNANLTPTIGVARFTPYRAITVTNVNVSIGETSSSPILLDIKKNNISILNGEYLTLNASQFTSGAIGLNFSLAVNDSLTVDIISAVGGKNLTLTLVYI